MNPVSAGNLILNNTLVGAQASLATSNEQDMSGSNLVNNIFSGPATVGTGASQSRNLLNPLATAFVAPARGDYRLRRRLAAVNAGGIVAPYTSPYVARAPDIGPYEYGRPPLGRRFAGQLNFTGFMNSSTPRAL